MERKEKNSQFTKNVEKTSTNDAGKIGVIKIK
jgi:hypothetical protein